MLRWAHSRGGTLTAPAITQIPRFRGDLIVPDHDHYDGARPGGQLAVFDGDYNTMSVATSEVDPLQACVAAMMQNFLNDPWIVRRLPGMITAAGFTGTRLRSHGYAQTSDPAYLLSIVDRDTEALVTSGRIGAELGEALKAEARRRVQAGSFFGY